MEGQRSSASRSLPHEEAKEEERAAVQQGERFLYPFDHLPTEIIAFILEYINATADELPDPFIVLHISGPMRRLALGVGTLFKDTARQVGGIDSYLDPSRACTPKPSLTGMQDVWGVGSDSS